MPLLRKKIFKEADRKSSVKNMIKALKSDEINIVDDLNEDIDEMLKIDENDKLNQNDDDDTKHNNRITDYKKDDDIDLNEDDADKDDDFDEVDADPNFDFKFNSKKNKLTFEIEMSIGGAKLVIDNQIKDVLKKTALRDLKDVKKTVYDEMEVSENKSKKKIPTIIVNGCNFDEIYK